MPQSGTSGIVLWIFRQRTWSSLCTAVCGGFNSNLWMLQVKPVRVSWPTSSTVYWQRKRGQEDLGRQVVVTTLQELYASQVRTSWLDVPCFCMIIKVIIHSIMTFQTFSRSSALCFFLIFAFSSISPSYFVTSLFSFCSSSPDVLNLTHGKQSHESVVVDLPSTQTHAHHSYACSSVVCVAHS